MILSALTLAFFLSFLQFAFAAGPAVSDGAGDLCPVFRAFDPRGSGAPRGAADDHVSNHTFSVTIKNPKTGLSREAVVRFFPKDSWGIPKEFAGKVFDCTLRVADRAEAEMIMKQIIHSSPELLKAAQEKGLLHGGLEIPDVMQGSVGGPQDRVPGEGFQELTIIVPSNSSMLKNQKLVLDALTNMGLTSVSGSRKAPVDLATPGGRREWAYYSFLEWAKGLTHEEVGALRELGGPNYRSINGYLRNGAVDGHFGKSGLEGLVNHIDSAIGRGITSEEVTVFRADSNPELLRIWEAAETGEKSRTFTDPAYTFSTLEESVANWWNSSQLKDQGVLMKIKVPSGANAAYIDGKRIHENRGFQEIVLPRNTKFKITGAYHDATGRRVLEVEVDGGK